MMFKRELRELVLSGVKTQTRRLHKRKLKEGRVYPVKKGWMGLTGASIRITRVSEERLGEITLEDARKEGFRSVSEFMDAWLEINGYWDPNQIVTVYDFELVKQTQETL